MPKEPFDVAWTPTGKRDLARLPEKVATAVVEFAYGSLAATPHRLGHALQLDLLGLHSARRGQYRIIYRIDEGTRTIHVASVDSRRGLPPTPRQATAGCRSIVAPTCAT